MNDTAPPSPRPSTRAVGCAERCALCSVACPIAYRMELLPHDLVGAVRDGDVLRAAASNTPWLCFQCEACSHACPSGVDVMRQVLRMREHAPDSDAPLVTATRFRDELFSQMVSRRGRIDLIRIWIRAAKATGRGALPISLRLALLIKGKLCARGTRAERSRAR